MEYVYYIRALIHYVGIQWVFMLLPAGLLPCGEFPEVIVPVFVNGYDAFQLAVPLSAQFTGAVVIYRQNCVDTPFDPVDRRMVINAADAYIHGF